MTTWVDDKIGVRVCLSNQVVQYFSGYRQLSWLAKEAGGPLFSSHPGRDVLVNAASGPFLKDRRTRNGYIPHRASVQGEINAKHAIGQHFIGTWHTHPSEHPIASGLDIQSTENLYSNSAHDLELFVMIIVGTNPKPHSWEVSAFGVFGRVVLAPVAEQTHHHADEAENQ